MGDAIFVAQVWARAVDFPWESQAEAYPWNVCATEARLNNEDAQTAPRRISATRMLNEEKAKTERLTAEAERLHQGATPLP